MRDGQEVSGLKRREGVGFKTGLRMSVIEVMQ